MRVRSKYKIKPQKKRNWHRLIWTFFVIILFAAVLYFFVFSGIFKIKSINAQGTNKVTSKELSSKINEYLNKKILRFVSTNNFFFVSEDKLKLFLLNEFPAVKEIEVQKKIPSFLNVTAFGREKIMVYCHLEKCYSLDDEGVIFEDSPAIFGGINAVVDDVSVREVKLGEKAISSDLISFIMKTNKELKEKANLSLLNFEIGPNPAADLAAITSEGWRIILDPALDYRAQLISLRQVLDERIREQRNKLEYIDLRIDNRVYYKMK